MALPSTAIVAVAISQPEFHHACSAIRAGDGPHGHRARCCLGRREEGDEQGEDRRRLGTNQKRAGKDSSQGGYDDGITKEGKFTVTIKESEKNSPQEKGTFEVTDDTIATKIESPGKDVRMMKIKTLTDKELVLEIKSDDKTVTLEFKKK
jgi:hypothetical protein